MESPFLSSIDQILRKQQENREKESLELLQKQWQKNGELTDKAALRHAAFCSQEFHSRVLSLHPARILVENLNNVKRAFDILTRSREAFIEIVGKFHARVMHDHMETSDFELALSVATKEVYTYSIAAVSLVQAYRHLLSGNPEIKADYDTTRVEVFGDSQIVKFFSHLRNSYNHSRILIASPHYTITHGDSKEVVSGIAFDKDAILKNDDWPQETKPFIEAKGDLQVIDLINEHYKMAKRFFDIIIFRTGIYKNVSYRDYYRILQARTVAGHLSTMGIMLQIAVPKNLNPYQYLNAYFTPEQLLNIYCLKDHTKEQVDYMISLKDTLGLCDESTRGQLYKLFQVQESEPAVVT
ncbi:hypothetical protein [Mesorhizobium sp. M1322]|uniref:hypothetical protein n=1 Tax=Mesorhizobium sp. M1322 TaxID=2957081 RepID=UPI0033368EBE